MHEAGDDVLAAVRLHVVEAFLPVERAVHGRARLQGRVTEVHDAAVFVTRVGHGRIAQFSPVGELAAAFGIERGAVERDFPALFPLHAAGHDGVEFLHVGLLIKQFVHVVHFG